MRRAQGPGGSEAEEQGQYLLPLLYPERHHPSLRSESTARTGMLCEPPRPLTRRVRRFEALALSIESMADLPTVDALASGWILQEHPRTAAARAFGEHWWQHLTIGRWHFVGPEALPWMDASSKPDISFEACLTALLHARDHLLLMRENDRPHARDAMVLARSRGALHGAFVDLAPH